MYEWSGGFPGVSDSKESACKVGDPGSISGSGRSPGEGNGNPLQYSCLENPMDRGAWWATVHRVAESNRTEGLTFTHHWLTLLRTWNEPNTVNQLHSNKHFLKKKEKSWHVDLFLSSTQNKLLLFNCKKKKFENLRKKIYTESNRSTYHNYLLWWLSFYSLEPLLV